MLNFGNKEFRNLQEQVLKNAQDIETLKGRENLQVVIVNELPEVGNPNYIYLLAKDAGESPDVYDEYIWLEDEERYEKIGGVSIDLTNYVTLDSEQTITGAKTINSGSTTSYLYFENSYDSAIYAVGKNNDWLYVARDGIVKLAISSGQTYSYNSIRPGNNNSLDLGSSSYTWKDLYLSGSIDFGNDATITKDSSNRLNLNNGSDAIIKVGNINSTYCKANWTPDQNNIYNLGRSGSQWKDLYLSGNISDGINSVTVANIASKVTSTFISGTFDANGEATIDTEQAGTPEGLFIFTYGNCQCFLRLTAAMVNSADVTPIRVVCPMIYNGAASLGWLNITKSGYILILTITDGTNHVDSGYAWTLTKTNLL